MIHRFLKAISPKVNRIAYLEFEFAVQHINCCATVTPRTRLVGLVFKKYIRFQDRYIYNVQNVIDEILIHIKIPILENTRKKKKKIRLIQQFNFSFRTGFFGNNLLLILLNKNLLRWIRINISGIVY